MIRVGVIGAAGRMGQMVCRTVAEEPDLALVAAIDRSKVGQSIGSLIGQPKLDVPISDELDRLLEAEVEVAVDFTHPEVVMDDVRWCMEHGINLVVGTTGIDDDELDEIRKLIEDEGGEPPGHGMGRSRSGSRPTVRPGRVETARMAISTPGMNELRSVESCRIVRVWPWPPKMTS